MFSCSNRLGSSQLGGWVNQLGPLIEFRGKFLGSSQDFDAKSPVGGGSVCEVKKQLMQ